MIANHENVNDGWLECPYCGKKLLKIHRNTIISGLPFMCKKCKQEFMIEIRPKGVAYKRSPYFNQ